jgi:hypothetical protein
LAGDRIAALTKQDLSVISFFYTEINNAADSTNTLTTTILGASYWLVKQFCWWLIHQKYTETHSVGHGSCNHQSGVVGNRKVGSLPLKAAIATVSRKVFRAALGLSELFH